MGDLVRSVVCHRCGRPVDQSDTIPRAQAADGLAAAAGLLCCSCTQTLESLSAELQSASAYSSAVPKASKQRVVSHEGIPQLTSADRPSATALPAAQHKHHLSKRLGSLEGLLQQPSKRLQRHASASQLITPPNSPVSSSALRRRDSLHRLGDLEANAADIAGTASQQSKPPITRLGACFRTARKEHKLHGSALGRSTGVHDSRSLLSLASLAAELQPQETEGQLPPHHSLLGLASGSASASASEAAMQQGLGSWHRIRCLSAEANLPFAPARSQPCSFSSEQALRNTEAKSQSSADTSAAETMAYADMGCLQTLASSLAQSDSLSPQQQQQALTSPQCPPSCYKPGADPLEGDPLDLMRMAGHLLGEAGRS